MGLMHQEKPIANVHIPRTGGSSLRAFWIDLYGPEQVLLYSIKTEEFHFAADDGMFNRASPALYFFRDILAACKMGKIYNLVRRLDRQRREATRYSDELPSEFRIIHGHFSPKFVLKKFGDVRLVTVVRDPLERTLSGYFFLRKLESVDPQSMPPWYTSGMPFHEFAFLEPMVNYQTKFLETNDLHIFDYVGTSNDLERFCRYFDPGNKVTVHNLNTARRWQVELEPDFHQRFMKENAADYELYDCACRRTNTFHG